MTWNVIRTNRGKKALQISQRLFTNTNLSSTLIEARVKQINSQHVSTSLNYPAFMFSLLFLAVQPPAAAAQSSMSLKKVLSFFFRIIRSDSTRLGKIRLRHNRLEEVFFIAHRKASKPFYPCHEIFTSEFSVHETVNMLHRSLLKFCGLRGEVQLT